MALTLLPVSTGWHVSGVTVSCQVIAKNGCRSFYLFYFSLGHSAWLYAYRFGWRAVGIPNTLLDLTELNIYSLGVAMFKAGAQIIAGLKNEGIS